MKLVELYLNGSDQEKENLERRYGKTQLKTMVDEIQTGQCYIFLQLSLLYIFLKNIFLN